MVRWYRCWHDSHRKERHVSCTPHPVRGVARRALCGPAPRLTPAHRATQSHGPVSCADEGTAPRGVAWDGIGLALYDATGRKLYFRAMEIEPQPGVVPLSDVPLEETMTWWVYQHQQPLVIPAVDTETRFPQLMARLKTYGIQSVCGLPLTTVHRRLGGLCLGSAAPNAYTDEEVGFLALVASLPPGGARGLLRPCGAAGEGLWRAGCDRYLRRSATRRRAGRRLSPEAELTGIKRSRRQRTRR
jgi:GAF domain-containing protein